MCNGKIIVPPLNVPVLTEYPLIKILLAVITPPTYNPPPIPTPPVTVNAPVVEEVVGVVLVISNISGLITNVCVTVV